MGAVTQSCFCSCACKGVFLLSIAPKFAGIVSNSRRTLGPGHDIPRPINYYTHNFAGFHSVFPMPVNSKMPKIYRNPFVIATKDRRRYRRGYEFMQ